MRPLDLDTQRLGEFRRTTGMIDMAMGQQDLLDGDARLLDGLEDHRNVTTGIDDRPHLLRLVIDERAVLLERGDGDDEGFQLCHGGSA